MGAKQLIATTRHQSKRPHVSSPIAAVDRFNNTRIESIESPAPLGCALFGLTVMTLPPLLALWRTRRRPPPALLLGLLLAAIPVGLAISAGAAGALFNYRHYSFAVPGYYLAVAVSVQSCLLRQGVRWAWVVAVTGLSAAALHANYTIPAKPDYRAGFAPLARSYRAGDCVTGLQRYWQNQVHYAWEVYYRERGVLRMVPFSSAASPPSECARLWVVSDRTWWMNLRRNDSAELNQLTEKLGPNYTVVEQYEHPAIHLRLLVRRRSGGHQ